MLAELKGSDSGLLQQLKGEVETLKSQIAKLQAENTELSTNNSALTSTNCELTEKMQRLLVEKAELQLTITKLETRTPQELLAEASARFKATSPPILSRWREAGFSAEHTAASSRRHSG
jgi:predicted nuclease with TOPRIM domain